jgi:hypothetical protein
MKSGSGRREAPEEAVRIPGRPRGPVRHFLNELQVDVIEVIGRLPVDRLQQII